MPWIRKTTRADVAQYIENFLNYPNAPDSWDDFVSVPIKGAPHLEAIRERATQLPYVYPVPPGEKGYCNEDGKNVLRKILEDLRSVE